VGTVKPNEVQLKKKNFFLAFSAVIIFSESMYQLTNAVKKTQ